MTIAVTLTAKVYQMARPSYSVTEYHPQACQFLLQALQFTQRQLGRSRSEEAKGHISGGELLEGVRQLGQQLFGMLCPVVFQYWGINSTEDFGRIVFAMIDSGDMKKTPEDSLEDFINVYDFQKAFVEQYELDENAAC